MLNGNNLKTSQHERCRCIAIAAEAGLPVPESYELSQDELTAASAAKLEPKLRDRFFTVHALSRTQRLARDAKSFRRYSRTRLGGFLTALKKRGANGALITSSGKSADFTKDAKRLLFFALTRHDGKLMIEGVRGKVANLYRKGKTEFAFVFENPTSDAPREVLSTVAQYHRQILAFIRAFGETSVLELAVIKKRFIFFEAKKEGGIRAMHVTRNDETPIVVPKQTVMGVLTDASANLSQTGKHLLYARRPDVALVHKLVHAKAFVFKEGSVLCHLAIVLRERNIPSVIVPNADALVGKKISLTPAGTVNIEGP